MAQLQDIPLIVIGGPTGVGKTALSLEIAHQFNGEIINGDSMQVYRHLDIGTGKIRPDEQGNIPHHLLDVIGVEEKYDASRFKHEAKQIIQTIWQKGKLPIVVGGTGLYLEGLLYDLEFGGDDSVSKEVRQALQAKANQIGNHMLWQELKAVDPVAAQSISEQNVRRVIRALEVIQTTGKLFSEQDTHHKQQSVFNECVLILDIPRPQLYDKINTRVSSMVEEGLEQEAKWLFERAESKSLPSMKGIGYKEWRPYFEGIASHDSVVELIQQNSRRYAKRQLTWFRNRMKETNWLDNSHPEVAIEEAITLIQSHITQ